MSSIKVCVGTNMYTWSNKTGWQPSKVVRAYQRDGDSDCVYSGHEIMSGVMTFQEALDSIAAVCREEETEGTI